MLGDLTLSNVIKRKIKVRYDSMGSKMTKVRTSITIDPQVLSASREAASLEGKSFSALVESCLAEYVGDAVQRQGRPGLTRSYRVEEDEG